MRVLVVHPGPHFSVADVYRGWSKALRALGATVVEFNLHDRLNFYEGAFLKRDDDGEYVKALTAENAVAVAAKGVETACYELWPDVVLVVSGFFLPPATLDLMRTRGHHVVLLHTESPYEDDRQVARAAHADLNLVNDPTNLARFREVSSTLYVPHAYDPAIHRPRPPQPDLTSDFCFVGTGYRSRIDFLEAVDWSGIDVALGGNWQQLDQGSPLRKHVAHDIDECLDNEQAADLYAATKASANLYRREADRPELSDGWAMGPREVELAATGTFFLRESRGEGDEVLSMLPVFDGPEDFADQLRWWLRQDGLRANAADLARAAVADRTFTANARRLLRLVA